MKITLTRDCRIGGEHCESGTVVEVSDSDGNYLVNSKSATRAGATTKAKKATIKKQKIVMRRACMVGGKHVHEGATVTVLARDADYLLAHGEAVDAGDDEAAAIKAQAKHKADAFANAAEQQHVDGDAD